MIIYFAGGASRPTENIAIQKNVNRLFCYNDINDKSRAGQKNRFFDWIKNKKKNMKGGVAL